MARFRSSEPSGPRTTARAAAGGAAATAVLSAAALLSAADPPTPEAPAPADTVSRSAVAADAPPAFHGEHGLWVEADGLELRVRWITRRPARGRLVAVADGDTVSDVATRRSTLHTASVRLPRRGDAVTLAYGARGDPDDRHETTVRRPLTPPRASWSVDDVDSLFVVGDVHGRFDTLVALLRNAGLVGEDLRWTGGDSHLVLLGDVFDRGPDVTRTLWFLYGLEAGAREAGGRMHLVLGNHEIMVLTDDLRYTSAKERMLADLHGVAYPRLFDVRRSVLGRWLASRPAVLRVDDVLLAHGGLGPAYRDWTVEALNDSTAAYMQEDLFLRWSDSTVEVAPMDSTALWRRIDFFTSPGSVFWYRGYLQPRPGGGSAGEPAAPQEDHAARGAGEESPAGERPDAAPGEALRRMLAARSADLHVVAHTPLDRVRSFHDGRLVGVDLRSPASELLLLVRSGDGWARFRWDLQGGPVPLEGEKGAGAH